MNKDKRVIELPEDIKSKIAAGEVIEGPFSVVKELIENSIDAESSKITIDIEDGGKRLISVSDNGTGIHPDDLELVTKRYSTSKINESRDLERINSLGFRGEALSSISSVAQVEILSKFKEEDVGKYIKVKNGEIVDKKIRQRQRGTSVIVKYLFNNYPARRKFLHSANAEFRKIMGEVIPKSIAFPGISFVLTHNGKEVINVSSGTRNERIISIFDESFLSSLMPIRYSSNSDVIVNGWIQRPDLPSSKKYYLFVNDRNVWDGKIFHVFKEFYTPFNGENPSFIIFLDVPPEKVDVNVHPAKKEIRFENEGNILNILRKALEEELGERGSYRKELFSFESDYLFEGKSENKFWQLHDSYIVAQTSNGMVIIDQHAAHERIIYDSLEREKEFPSQSLLFPLQIKHTSVEISRLEDLKEEFHNLGFRFRILSGNSVIWEGIPSIVEDVDENSLKGILEDLSEERETEIDKLLQTLSCHLAVKAGDNLSIEEMEHLVNKLFSTENPFRCPHGRPVIHELSLEDLEKKFLR